MADVTLYIGNKNYSSWSLRPWLALRWGGIAFEERVIPLGGEGYGVAQIKDIVAVSPSGKVPCLNWNGTTIQESLAICEWAAEQAPSLWPKDAKARALARAAASEMHAGFAALRRDMSMNIRRRLDTAPAWPEDTQRDLTRLFELWGAARKQFAGDGPWLFGTRSIADAMFAPVTTRLRTYKVSAPAASQAYCETMFADADFKDWERAGIAETWTIPQSDELYT
ncbi:glutathione S-transferase [alpha proteobacterium U9-1i]|nr:glutathione S-transferase [alpha proteobacterium U9-1i]